MDKFPDIYKNKINSIKSKVQEEFYYHAKDNINESNRNLNVSENSNVNLLDKIENIFKRPNYVYQADVNIMYKNGEIKQKTIVGFKKNYLMTLDGERIDINEINDIN